MVEGTGLENRRASNGTEGSNPSLSARKSVELFPDAKKLENSTKDPLRVFLFTQGLANKAPTQKGFGTDNSCRTQKTMELFVRNLKRSLNCGNKLFVFQI